MGLKNKMAICPKCKRNIVELNMRRTGTEYARMYIDDSDGYPTYDGEEFDTDDEGEWYNCPECSEELFTNWDEAEEFLKGRDELQRLVAEKIEKIKDGKKQKT